MNILNINNSRHIAIEREKKGLRRCPYMLRMRSSLSRRYARGKNSLSIREES